MDRVQVIKWESPAGGGTETDDVPTEINPQEDYVEARGYCIQNDTSEDNAVIVSRDASNNMTFKDGVQTTPVTLSDLASGGGGGLTPSSHAALDQLVHELSETHYEEVIYTGGKVTGSIVWTDSGKTLRIRDYTYTYTGTKVTTEVVRQYDALGVVVETLTYTYNYTGSNITSVDCVRT